MTLRVIVLPNAKANLYSYYLHAAKHAPVTAARWMERFESAIESLASLPERWPLAPEDKLLNRQSQMLFGKRPNVYRVFFWVIKDRVEVLHVRRAAMDLASLTDIFGEAPPADEP